MIGEIIAAAQLRQPFAGFSGPRFNTDPVQKPVATVNTPYAVTLVGDVTDTNANETLTLTKLSGPGWLTLAPDGALSGTPMR